MNQHFYRGICDLGKNQGEWVYGNLLGDSIIIPKGQELEIEGDKIYDTLQAFSVDPETVGQFTGLSDKNGKMIFDGDIIHYSDGNSIDGIGYVEWWRDGWFIIDITGDIIQLYDIKNISEVCGTIHDKSEGKMI